MSATLSRKQRRAKHMTPVLLRVTLHSDGCNAPLVPCSCASETHYIPIETPADLIRVADARRAWIDVVRARLD